MKTFRRLSSSLLVTLLAAISSAQIGMPAVAQGTVLMGKVQSINAMTPSVPLMPRQAEFDTTPHYGGATYVNPSANRKYSGNVNSGVQRNFQPQRPMIRTVYVRDNRTFFQRHPNRVLKN
jgi:hypothetical protein